MLRPVVQAVVVKGVAGNGTVPVKAQGRRSLGLRGLDVDLKSAYHANAAKGSLLGHGIDGRLVGRVGQYVKAVAKVKLGPVAVADRTLSMVCRTLPRAVVLHSAINVVGQLVVNTNVVELSQGKVFGKAPALAAVVANVESAVVAFDEVVGRLARKPKRMVVGVDVAVGRHRLPAAAAVV